MTQYPNQRDFQAQGTDIISPQRALSCVHFSDAIDEYKMLEAQNTSIFGIHQQSMWLENWAEHVNDEIYILCIHENNRLVFALPFEMVRHQNAWIGRYPAGVHSNANFPMMDRLATYPTRLEFEALKNIAQQSVPKMAALYLERQLQCHSGVENPVLKYFTKTRSPNLALSASLTGGFEGILSRVNKKRRMKRHRQQKRGLQAIGPIIFEVQTEPEAIEETLDIYLECKSKQLAEMGAPNNFAGDKHRSFMRANYLKSAEALKRGEAQTFALQTLRVNGIIRAILGTCLNCKGVSVEIVTHRNDETSHCSAGEFLICESIQHACDNHLEFYDLGLGDHPYKRSWCREEIWHYDTVIAFSVYGYCIAFYHRGLNFLKAYIKDRPSLWKIAAQIRSIIGPIMLRIKALNSAYNRYAATELPSGMIGCIMCTRRIPCSANAVTFSSNIKASGSNVPRMTSVFLCTKLKIPSASASPTASTTIS